MKKVLAVLVLFVLCGCSDPHKELNRVNVKLESMYNEIAECSALAECMGGTSGKVQGSLKVLLGDPYTYVNPGNYYKSDEYEYTCTIKYDIKVLGIDYLSGPHGPVAVRKLSEKTDNIQLEKISTMLEGCQSRECGATCKKEKK